MIVPLVMPTDSITLLRHGKKISRENAFQLLDFVQNSSDLMKFPAADNAQLILFPSRNEVWHVFDREPLANSPVPFSRGENNPDAVHTGSGLVVVARYKNARKCECLGREK